MTKLEIFTKEDTYETARNKAIKWVQTYFLADGLRASHLFMEFFNLTEKDLEEAEE